MQDFEDEEFRYIEDKERENELYEAMLTPDKDADTQRQLLQNSRFEDLRNDSELQQLENVSSSVVQGRGILSKVNFRHMDLREYNRNNKNNFQLPRQPTNWDYSNWHRLTLSQLFKQIVFIAQENKNHPEQHIAIPPEYLCILYDANLLDDQLINSLRMYDINHLIRWFCRNGNLQVAEQFIERLLQLNRVNSHTFAMYLESFVHGGTMDMMISQWDKWTEQGIDIGPVGASAIVKVCCAREGESLALEVLEKCLMLGIRLNVHTFNTLLMHYAKQGNLDECLDIFNVLRFRQSEDVKPTPITYSAILLACAKNQKYRLARLVRRAQIEDEVFPDGKLLCQYIYIFARGGMVYDAQECFIEAQERSMVTMYIANALLNAYARQGMWHESKRLYSCILEDDYCRPDQYTFVSMFTAAARGQAPSTQFAFLEEDMQKQKVPMNTYTACALLQAYRLAHDVPSLQKLTKGKQIVKIMQEQGIYRNTEFYNCLLGMAYDLGSYQRTMKIYQQMLDDGAVPDEDSFRVLITCCREFGQEQKAQELIQVKKTMEFLQYKSSNT